MEIRDLRGRADLRDVIRAHGRAWRAAYDDILPRDVLDRVTVEPDDDAVQAWEDRLREDRAAVLVAADEAWGYAYFRWGDETKAFVGPEEAGLKELYVHPDCWGRGVGTRLLERGIERLPDGVERVALETFTANDLARGFYEARGFEPVDEGEVALAGESYPTVIYARALGRSDGNYHSA